MGRQNQNEIGNPVHQGEKLQGSPFSTAAVAASSSPSIATVVTTAVSATVSSTTPPAPRPVLDLAPDALVHPTRKDFSDLPAELREEVAEWLDEAGATKSLLNLSLVEKKMRECLAMKNHRTEVWFHKGKQQRFKWWYAEESPQIRSIRYLFQTVVSFITSPYMLNSIQYNPRHLMMVIKPTFDNRQLPHEMGGHPQNLVPDLKSFAKWDRYDKVTGKWGKHITLRLFIYPLHGPDDFLRTLRSLRYAPATNTKKSGLKGAALKVMVHCRDEGTKEMDQARDFFPERGYGLRDVELCRVNEKEKGFPVSIVAQFAGALSFEDWKTSLVVSDCLDWSEKEKLIRFVAKKWIKAIITHPETVNLTFEVYDPAGNTSIARLSATKGKFTVQTERNPQLGRFEAAAQAALRA
ncbi:hypothetical protein QFC21_005663 [Naganishia friedmannii]|uniref:Uncharacterized protein n=1 Tax=Naganishia friedmannii TaxID=89922 RepID=A0ACC2V9T2_9TREE|nr:hypothetical protein QFC21_005663 [Naganishia friedmannii]